MAFRDLPIRRKLLLTTFASSAVAVLLAISGFLTWDIYQFRAETEDDMLAQARIIAENTAPALTFNDMRAAGENLAILRLRPRVRFACVYQSNGQLFATYRHDPADRCPPAPPATGRFGWDHFDLVEHLRTGGDDAGVLFIERGLEDLYARLRFGLGTVVGLLLVAIAAAFLVAGRMQRAVVLPLLDLASIARKISAGRDYTLRALPRASDEVGVVVYAFNDMLDAIGERTTELSKSNRDLEREIDERKKLEVERTAALARERDANRLKDEFLATLSHELRTPLNAVLGWTRVLRTTPAEGATRERALESIERNARAQARLIEDLLEISRIVTGKLRLQMQHVDLAAIVDAAVEVMQPAAAAKRIALDVAVATRPAMTAGDADRLQQIVWNLLSNAVKFTPPEGRVTVRLEHEDGYRITVGDTGAGIDQQFLPYVFEPFRQADGTASREHGGLGLGLAIAKQLVELHGGTIVARSEGRGAGATFEVRLPSVVAAPTDRLLADALAQAAPAPGPADPSLLQHVRVLVVDDEEDARTLMHAALRSFGADVVLAGSAAEALAEIDRRVPDVILSDIGMPYEDGYALMRRVRTRTAVNGGAVPAIAVTAYASARDRDAATAAGYQAHVAKPYEPGDVAALVARLAGVHS
jgi:signal transduction histidine kinase/ActR/RegA family two-component response regulator